MKSKNEQIKRLVEKVDALTKLVEQFRLEIALTRPTVIVNPAPPVYIPAAPVPTPWTYPQSPIWCSTTPALEYQSVSGDFQNLGFFASMMAEKQA